MARRATFAASLLALCIGLPAQSETLSVIVHPERAESPDRNELEQIYLKRRRFWGDGDAIIPINRNAASEVRRAFDAALFGAGARRLMVYWNREYFRGVLPPATLASDEAVKRFLAREPRAIGYIRSSTVDDTVRVVLELEAPGLSPPGASPDGSHRWPPLPPVWQALVDSLRATFRVAAWRAAACCDSRAGPGLQESAGP